MTTQAELLEMAKEQQRRIRATVDCIKQRIVVFSGKGGVGKTTIAVNLAYALANRGSDVGLLDADLTGPNVPKMVGLQGRPPVSHGGPIMPLERHGLKVVSLATFIPPDSPVIWRGPLRSKTLDQFLGDVDWGLLDFLVADLPPGTGDEVMTIAQHMEPQTAVIVTTPQEMSLIDSRRAINMARKMNIPRIGVVENMSGLRCPDCGSLIEVFGSGGGARIADEFGVRFLGSVPMNLNAREGADRGAPVILSEPQSDISQALLQIAQEVLSLTGEGWGQISSSL